MSRKLTLHIYDPDGPAPRHSVTIQHLVQIVLHKVHRTLFIYMTVMHQTAWDMPNCKRGLMKRSHVWLARNNLA